jgi:hypothetical protein
MSTQRSGGSTPRQTIILRIDKNVIPSRADALKCLILSGMLMYAQERVIYGTLNQHWDEWKIANQPRHYLQMPRDQFEKFQKTLHRFPHTVFEIGGEAVLSLPPAEDAINLPGLKKASPLTINTDPATGSELFPPSASSCPNIIVEADSKSDITYLADAGSRQMLRWIEMLNADEITRWYDTGAQLALFGVLDQSEYKQLYFHAGVRDVTSGVNPVKGAFVIPPRELPTIKEVRNPVFVATVDFRDFLQSKKLTGSKKRHA